MTATGLEQSIKVLGQVGAADLQGMPLDIGGPTQRRVLAALVLRTPDASLIDWLVDTVWPDPRTAPARPTETIRTYVARLRRVLPPDAILTVSGGYRLSAAIHVDVHAFDELVRRSAEAETSLRLELVESALSLWRGDPYAPFTDDPAFATEVRRLHDLHLLARERRAECLLDLDRHRDALPDIEALAAEHPLRESPRRMHMLALHAIGAQAEALRSYQRYRRLLTDELGLDVSPELRDLEQRIAVRDPSIGRSLPDTPGLRGFEIIRQLGADEHSAIYEARQPGLARTVALRVIDTALADQPEFIRNFEVDGRALARVEHPNVVALHDYWRDPSGAYLVMRYLEGGSLADRLAEGTQTEDEAIRWVADIAAGLDALHRTGIVHGDLRPSNILFDAEGTAVLGDAVLGSNGGHATDDVARLAELADTALGAPTDRPFESTTASDFAAAFAEAFEADVPPAHSGPNPYRGLQAFDESDADVFCGRDADVEAVLAQLDAGHFAAVIGPSGSGKSSLVRAGVVPRLRATTEAFVITMTPGTDPFAELESALRAVAVHRSPLRAVSTRTAEVDAPAGELLAAIRSCLADPAPPIVLIIDQFEELYTITASDELRTAFIDQLTQAIDASAGSLDVIVTLRADFFDRPLQDDDLAEIFTRHQVTTLPLRTEDLERAISAPAERAGAAVEPALIATLVDDIRDAPQALPMLQYTLTELYDRTENATLNLADYREIGGVAGAIGSRAEYVHRSLSDDARQSAQHLFTELVTVDDNVETRRRAPIDALLALPGADEILDQFGAARLVVFDHDPVTRGPTVEVAHEALIREWPRFRGWVDAGRDRIRTGRWLSDSADRWATSGRDRADTLRGARLETAVAWREAAAVPPSDTVAAFVDASIDAQNLEQEREERVARRLRLLVKLVAGVAVVAVGASIFAGFQQRRASSEADDARAARADAETRRMSAEASRLVTSNRRLALLLAAEAYRRDPSSTSLGGLQTVLSQADGLVRYLAGDDHVTHVEWLGQDTLAVVTPTNVQISDVNTAEPLTTFAAAGVTFTSYDAEIDAMAMASATRVNLWRRDGGEVDPIDVETRIASIDMVDGTIAIGHVDGTVSVIPVDAPAAAMNWDAHPETGREGLGVDAELVTGQVHQPETFHLGTRAIALSGDGSILATGSQFVVRLWDTATGAELAEFETTRLLNGERTLTGVSAIAFASDGSVRVATPFNVSTWTIDGQQIDETSLPGRENAVTSGADTDASISLGGDHVALALSGGTVSVVPLSVGNSVADLVEAHLPGVPSVALSPAGDRVALGTLDGAAVLSVTGATPISTTFDIGNASEVAVTADGGVVVASVPDSQPPLVFDVETGEPVLLRTEGTGQVDFAYAGETRLLGIDFSTDDQATFGAYAFGYDGSEQLFMPHIEVSLAVAEAPNGSLIAMTGSLDILISDGSTGDLITELRTIGDPEAGDLVRSIGFSPDSRRLVAATTAGAAMVWDTQTWEPIQPVLSEGGGAIVQAKFSRDGRWLVTLTGDGTLQLRDAQSFQPVRELSGNTDALSGFSHGPFFTDDGRYMVTTADRRGRLWDLEAGTQIGRAIPSDPGTSPNAAPTGQWLATIEDGVAHLWNLDVDSWFDIACAAAGRNMTAAEWEQFGPADEPYRATCAQWADDNTSNDG